MQHRQRLAKTTAAVLAFLLIAPAWGANMNKSIKIKAGEGADGATTVNGSISIGSGAVVSGSVETVNGTIRIDSNAQVQDAQTVNGSVRVDDGVSAGDISSVNGSIQLGSNVIVAGELSVVNGKITTKSGTSVSNDISTVNGQIKLAGTQAGGDLTTVNGDVLLEDQSVLQGNLHIEKAKGWGDKKKRKPKVVIGPGSRVVGEIILEREVELYISESAQVGGVSGVMAMTDAVRFKGSRP